MAAYRATSTISESTPANKFYIGSIVRWTKSEDQLWVLILVQKPLYIIRTLPFEDGSFVTRTVNGCENLTLIQNGNIVAKDVSGMASKFSRESLPQ